MDFHSFLIHIQHIHWQQVIRNPQTRHYLWEVAKVLVPVFLTGLITFTVMKINDSRNKKRWLNDSFIKHQNDLILRLNRFLPDFLTKFDSHFNIFENTPVKMVMVYDFLNKYTEDINELNAIYTELSSVSKIEIKPLARVLYQFNYLKNYKTEDSETPVLTLLDGAQMEIDEYLHLMSDDLLKSKNDMVKIIQKKLR